MIGILTPFSWQEKWLQLRRYTTKNLMVFRGVSFQLESHGAGDLRGIATRSATVSGRNRLGFSEGSGPHRSNSSASLNSGYASRKTWCMWCRTCAIEAKDLTYSGTRMTWNLGFFERTCLSCQTISFVLIAVHPIPCSHGTKEGVDPKVVWALVVGWFTHGAPPKKKIYIIVGPRFINCLQEAFWQGSLWYWTLVLPMNCFHHPYSNKISRNHHSGP